MRTINRNEQLFELFPADAAKPVAVAAQNVTPRRRIDVFAPDPNLLHWACPHCHRAPEDLRPLRCLHCQGWLVSPGSWKTNRRKRPATRQLWTDTGFAHWLEWVVNGTDDVVPAPH